RSPSPTPVAADSPRPVRRHARRPGSGQRRRQTGAGPGGSGKDRQRADSCRSGHRGARADFPLRRSSRAASPRRCLVSRYRYVSQLNPPAPFILVTLRNPVTGAEQQAVPAQVDSAADRTLLPEAIVQALVLPQIGSNAIGGVGGIIQTLPSYPVQVTIHNRPAQTVEVVASAGENWILLGRDILNAHRTVLDGPQQFTEIG